MRPCRICPPNALVISVDDKTGSTARDVRTGQAQAERIELTSAETFIGFLHLLDRSIP